MLHVSLKKRYYHNNYGEINILMHYFLEASDGFACSWQPVLLLLYLSKAEQHEDEVAHARFVINLLALKTTLPYMRVVQCIYCILLSHIFEYTENRSMQRPR